MRLEPKHVPYEH